MSPVSLSRGFPLPVPFPVSVTYCNVTSRTASKMDRFAETCCESNSREIRQSSSLRSPFGWLESPCGTRIPRSESRKSEYKTSVVKRTEQLFSHIFLEFARCLFVFSRIVNVRGYYYYFFFCEKTDEFRKTNFYSLIAHFVS